ncbi:hypothetical protein ANN_15803 [Periplaneta americana]|uniref:Uncharacterized protein n=1 Tax=Periplaneta americana TaxID=6978 RepID=A0ABQ8SH90_PERAM|nr:hypothetical protein ANN_15803 [Periplaneta americana]
MSQTRSRLSISDKANIIQRLANGANIKDIAGEFKVILRRFINIFGYLASEWDEGDNVGEMSPGSSTESYSAFAHIELRENPGKNLNQELSSSQWTQAIKMNCNRIPVRTLPGKTLDSTRCRRCDEQETLPHVLGFCHHGELLRINRHNTVRSLIASSIRQNASYEVYEEVVCVSSDGSTRRADIIIIDRQKDKGVILDPTIRFEMHEQQPQEVCREKQVIYEPCCQHLGAQYHITHWTDFELIRWRWAGHVARMSESRNAYRVLVGRPEGKRPLGRPRRRWEDNIKMDLREVGYDDRDWINLAQDRDQ